ncbi:MAG: hypothetical protein ACYSTY_09955 [Planctomycetota bacterium]|jgi:hypothetical protein
MRRVALIAATLGGLALLVGCQQALWPSNAPRSQFETYDRMHNRYVPIEEPDVFGHPRPALRARLSNSR